MELVNFFEKLNKISLYLLLFLIPIFFLPLTQNFLDFPKQVLAQILISLSFIGWIGKIVLKGKINLRGNKIFYLSLLFILISLLISSLFSISLKQSFLGLSFDYVDSFLNHLLLMIFTFLILNSFEEKSEILFLVSLLLFSGFIAGILNLLQIYKIFILPFDIAKSISFNTIGTPNAFSVVALLLLPISSIFVLRGKGNLKIIFTLTSIILFLNILFVNFKTAWSGLIVSILVLFIFGFGEKKLNSIFAPILMISLIISLFFYFFPITLKGFPLLPPEISLSFISELEIIKKAFSNKIKNLILGTGPSTFIFDYSQYRSSLLNKTIFWGTRFLRGHSMFFDWLLTKGILGILGLLSLYFLVFYYFFKNLRKGNVFDIKLAISASLFSFLFVSFFYPFNFTLWFLFWFLIGTFIFFFSEKEIHFKIDTPQKTMVFNFVFVLSLIFSLFLIFYNTKWYLAEVNYLKGMNATNVEKGIDYLLRATRLNPLMDNYWRDLSQLYLAQANLIAQDQKIPLEEKRNRVNLAIGLGAEAINKATNLAPMNVANWNVRGFFYQNLIGIEGAENQALASYRRAIQLEPSSSYSFAEIARVYILLAQNYAQKGEEEKKTENLNSAIDALNKALQLKPDYPVANYLFAVALDQLGKLDEAIQKLEATKNLTPQDFGIRFQLGMLYWRKGELEKAKTQFEEAIAINPDYSNARYMLGLIFDKIGEKEKAKEEFEIVAKLNPENQEVKKILENLEKGLPALEGITQTQQPIGETPPEIKK
jgi:Tfp pilus assembly protein PilF/O-antigen ligase